MSEFSSISWDAVRLARIRFSSRAVTIGFPGAGNVLANAICNRLSDEAGVYDSFGIGDRGSEEEPLVKNAVVSAFSARYNAMLSLLRSAAPEGTQSFFQNGNMGACDFMVPLSGGNFLIVRNVDIGVYLNARVHTTHELPLPATWEFYRSKGFKNILTLRHPLAVIASFASKIDPSNEWLEERWRRWASPAAIWKERQDWDAPTGYAGRHIC